MVVSATLLAPSDRMTTVRSFAAEETQSWAFMPFLREVFCAVVPGTRPLIVAIDLLRQYWPVQDTSFDEDISAMRSAYISLNLYEPIRHQYHMHEHSETYIASYEQEFLLGDFESFPSLRAEQISYVTGHLNYLRTVDDEHFATIRRVGISLTESIHNMRRAVILNGPEEEDVPVVISSSSEYVATIMSVSSVGDTSATVISHSPLVMSSRNSIPLQYQRTTDTFSPLASVISPPRPQVIQLQDPSRNRGGRVSRAGRRAGRLPTAPSGGHLR